MSFFTSFTRAASDNFMKEAQGLLATKFPDVMSEAAILQIEERYDALNLLLAKAEQKAKKEQDEADAIVKLHDQRIAVAEYLMSQGKEDAAQKVVAEVELMTADIEREQQEAVDANARVAQLRGMVETFGEKLKGARATVNKSKAALERAQLRKEEAKQSEEDAKFAAGLSNGLGGLSSALEAMERSADEATAEADAAVRKANMLKPVSLDDDPDIKAAKAALSGNAATTGMSLADRLAALKNKA